LVDAGVLGWFFDLGGVLGLFGVLFVKVFDGCCFGFGVLL